MSGRNGNKRIGRNAKKCTEYTKSGHREQHKVRCILQSSGMVAAQKYAKAKGLVEYLASLI